MTHMALYRFYDDKAREQKLLSPLLHFVANRHLREARRSAKYYPDPLELHASLLAKEGDLWKSAQEYEDIIPRQQAWIRVFGDPDGFRKLQLCVDISTAGAARSVLGQFTEALFWNMEAWKEFNELPADVRASHAVLE